MLQLSSGTSYSSRLWMLEAYKGSKESRWKTKLPNDIKWAILGQGLWSLQQPGRLLDVPLCLTLLFSISLGIYCCPTETGHRVCFEADQSFLSINSTFLRDHFSFSKAPNIKEHINKGLEKVFSKCLSMPFGSQLTLKFWSEWSWWKRIIFIEHL